MTAARQRKTSERERPLMEATLRIIGRTGLDGVTHRAVAAEAGMSVGAVTHHFETRDVLVDAALRFALTREVGRLRALAFSLQNKAFDVEAWIEQLVSWYARELSTHAETHIACYEAFLAAARGAPSCRTLRLRPDRHRPATIGGTAARIPPRGQSRALTAGPQFDCREVTVARNLAHHATAPDARNCRIAASS